MASLPLVLVVSESSEPTCAGAATADWLGDLPAAVDAGQDGGGNRLLSGSGVMSTIGLILAGDGDGRNTVFADGAPNGEGILASM